MQIVERIKSEAFKKGYTLAELEQKLGFGVRTIYKWNKNAPSVEKVLAVADFLNLPLSWLVTGKEEHCTLPNSFIEKYQQLSTEDKECINNYVDMCLNSTKSVHVLPPYIRENKLPVLGYSPTKIPLEHAKYLGYKTPNCDADYVLIMDDDSMLPLFQKGDYLYIKQTESLANGDIGIVLHNHQILCRQFLKLDKHVLLRPLNPEFTEDIYNTLDLPATLVIGKVLITPLSKR